MAIRRDPDWVTLLMGCHEDPTEGYLHTVLSSGEVLPFSDVLALAYEYPYSLGQEQPGLHSRLVYSSIYGIPLIVPAESKGLRVQTCREQARQALARGAKHVGYVTDKGIVGD